MKKESTHSQDYDRKHGHDHNVKDKAALRKEFIDDKRKEHLIDNRENDAGGKDNNHPVRTPDEGQ
jgi:hypothetical protein